MDINTNDRTTSIAEAVFNTIEQEILDGKLKNGEILTELKLCEILSVSRTPVREALKRLKQEGMIVESGK
ncbi:MAG: GntR family transcriptional regulator, partial [Ruminococcaceae bacterium]|nr:GntR family transcriptional regulator [Oscillospiraceae bacterium]